MASKGMLTGLWRQVERILLKRELVGIDALGNQYYRVWAKDDFGGLQEKRICKPQNSDPSAYTPESMPTEWSSWLRRQRREPPTEEEIERNDAARAAMRQRVALLEAEDLKRRLQAEARGGYEQAAAEPNLGRFLEQMTRVQEAAADSSNPPGDGSTAAGPQMHKPPPAKGSFQPSAWTPGNDP